MTSCTIVCCLGWSNCYYYEIVNSSKHPLSFGNDVGYRNAPHPFLTCFSWSFCLCPSSTCPLFIFRRTCLVLSLPQCVPSVRELCEVWRQAVLPNPACQGIGIHAELIPGLTCDSPQRNPHRGHITGPLVQLFHLQCMYLACPWFIKPIPFSPSNFPFRSNPVWL